MRPQGIPETVHTAGLQLQHALFMSSKLARQFDPQLILPVGQVWFEGQIGLE